MRLPGLRQPSVQPTLLQQQAMLQPSSTTAVVFVQRVPVSPEHSDIFLQPKIDIGRILLTLHLLYHSHISYSITAMYVTQVMKNLPTC